MAYAESVGISSFLNNLQQNLMMAAQQKAQQEEEIRKAAAERLTKLADSGRVMIQPQIEGTIPVSQPLLPTGDLNAFIQNPIPGLGIPASNATAPVVPKARVLTLEEQMNLPTILRKTGKLPEGYSVTPPDIPAGAADEVALDANGNVTKKWTPGQNNRATIAANARRAQYAAMSGTKQELAVLNTRKNMLMSLLSDISGEVNNSPERKMEILADLNDIDETLYKLGHGGRSKPKPTGTEAPAPIAPPAKPEPTDGEATAWLTSTKRATTPANIKLYKELKAAGKI